MTCVGSKFDKFARQIWFEKKKIIACVKDGGYNLNAMSFVLKYLVNCETLGLQESFNDTCFGHVYSKACQYVIIDEIVVRSLRYVSIKAIQADLQKCIIWEVDQNLCKDWNSSQKTQYPNENKVDTKILFIL